MPDRVRALTSADEIHGLRMRLAPWPEESAAGHRRGMQEWRARCDTAVLVVLADDDNEPVGFAEVGTRAYADGCESSPVGYLEGWYVDPTFRRRGLGRALVEASLAWARERRLREFASDALLENLDSQHAHRAVGFDEVERIVIFRRTL